MRPAVAPSRRSVLGFAASLLCPGAGRADEPPPPDAALRAALDGEGRNPRFPARDAARHPAEVLAFFGLKPGMTVVEIWPTGAYWTEILAPYLRAGGGTLVAALEAQPASSPNHDAALKRAAYFRRRLAEDPALFAGVRLASFGPGAGDVVPPNSADMVLAIRDLHLWMKQGFAEDALVDCYRALKPGGILALEDHRGNRPAGPQDIRAEAGYVRQDYAEGLAQLAGFEPAASSEIAANPRDTADWPHGVTTLGPTFALGAQDRERYAAVGEPDDFLLRFRKPK